MTATTLNCFRTGNLVQMARSQGVVGWHSMRKDDLVRALLKQSKQRIGSRRGADSVGTKPGPTANGSHDKTGPKIFAID